MTWTAAEWGNRGGQLLDADPRLGQRLIAKALCLEPDAAILLFNLGIALHQQRNIAAAIRAYGLALQQPEPPHKPIINNLAQDLLLNGQLRQGWAYYENRFKPGQHDYFKQLLGEPWMGHDPARPAHLVLVAEQGLGDTLQFCRYALALQNSGIRITLFCQPALVAYLSRHSELRDVTRCVEADQLEPGSCWCPLMSLPHRLGTERDSIPAGTPYLGSDPALSAAWNARLQRRAGHRLIGLHWQGNPGHEHSLYSRGRSMRFEDWLNLRPPAGVEFVSLQKGHGQEQWRNDAGLPFVAGQQAFNASLDFDDTAAVLRNCDLVISADSGIVHLAGAMGIPTWVALRWVPEWRWLLEGSGSPWYPSLRLFRQPRDGAWPEVVQAMAQALQQWSRDRR